MLDWNQTDRWLMGSASVESSIGSHVAELCDRIGVRWAGTTAEQLAIEYVANQFQEASLRETVIEPFDLQSWECNQASLAIGENQRLEVRPCMFCPSVNVSGELIDVGFGMPHDLDQIPKELIKGKIALIDAGHEPFSEPTTFPQRLRRLADAGVVAAMTPSTAGGRRTADFTVTDWRDADPYQVPLPVVQTSREVGARLRHHMSDPRVVTLQVEARRIQGTSSNVIGNLIGSEWPDESLVLSAHHDTTTDSFGANDNAAGVAVMLETARMLSQLQQEVGIRPGRTIRCISFGAEEQVLQGSSSYVATHHGPEPLPRLMINLDELATGTMKGLVLQFPELRQLVQSQLNTMNEGLACHVLSQLDVSGDMFPFSRRGIPSAILWRWRFVGRHPDVAFGHSDADTPDKLRFRELKEYAGNLARLLLRLSHVPPEEWPENCLDPDEIEMRIGAERGTVFRTM
ncbi:MAG: M28 family peptidase [Planctomycetaceae bacterium]|nr:M28 family peptidase [Planctomycetaceae bacterium]